jgi:polyketide biosynthesis acyl carrier protein
MSPVITREEVLVVVQKHMSQVIEGLEPERIDPAKSLADFGANSLDIVEIVSCAMRELKVKVPRAELTKLRNLNELVDLLHRVSVEKANAQPAA